MHIGILKQHLPPHHLYVCPQTSPELKRHLAFRNFLRTNPQYAQRLSDLKWELALKHNNDRQAYMEGKETLCKIIRQKAKAMAVY